MLFYAFHRDEYLIADPSINAVLAFVGDCNEPQFGEDAAVWCGGRLVVVCHPDGRLTWLLPDYRRAVEQAA